VSSKDQNAFQKDDVDGLMFSEISLDNFGVQVDIHDYFKGRVTASTQRTRLEFVDLFVRGAESLEEENILEMKNEYDAIIKEMIARDFSKVVDELGLTREGNTFTLSKENTAQFKNRLLEAFLSRDMAYNVAEGVDLSLNTDHQLFDFLVTNRELESVLISLARNDVLSRKMNGELLIQESNVIYDKSLKFYSKDETGVSKMEVMIPLPNSLKKYVKSIGGLDVFNKMIADGKVDKRIFEIPANRIPSHGPNSLEAMTVKKFLPGYVGAKIVLPAEITIKSGSDFDVDKLTTYYKHAKVIDGKLTYEEPSGELSDMTRGQLENRLMEISNDVLTHPARFNELVKPTNAKRLKALSNKYAPTKEDTKWSDLISLPFNVAKAKSFWRAKAGVALTANQTVSHATTQKNPIKIEDHRVRLFFKGQEKLEYSMGHLTDAKGNLISEVFAEFLTAFVDAAKDDFVSLLNANPNTMGAISFLLRTGTEFGVAIDDIVALTTQPIVLEYLKKRALAESIAMQVGYGFDSKEDTVAELLASYGVTNAKKVVEYQMLYKNFKDGKGKSKSADSFKEELEDYNYKYLTREDLSKKSKGPKLQKQILDNFLTYVEYGRKLSDFQSITKPDAGVKTSFAWIDRQFDKIESLMKSGFYNVSDIDTILQDSFLSPYFGVVGAIPQMYESFFLKLQYSAREALNGKFKIYRNPELGLSDIKLEKIEREIENKFTTALLFKATYTDSAAIQSAIFNRFISDNAENKQSLPSLLLSVKRLPELADNMLVQELMPMIQEYDRASGKNKTIDNMKLYNRKFTTDEINDLTSDFIDLFNHSDASIRGFAGAIAEFGLLQSGFQQSPVSFTNIIPNRAIVKQFETAVNNLKQNIGTVDMNNIIDLVIRNSWQDRDIVPRNRKKLYLLNGIAPKRIEVKSEKLQNYPYIVQPFVRVSKSKAKQMRLAGQKVPVQYLMYEKVKDEVYQRTHQYGDGRFLMEFYPDIPLMSVIDGVLPRYTINVCYT